MTHEPHCYKRYNVNLTFIQTKVDLKKNCKKQRKKNWYKCKDFFFISSHFDRIDFE